MPTYLYACPICRKRQEAVRRIADRDDSPRCCGGVLTERRITATMVSVFTPYRAVAADKDSGERPFIRSKAEHEAFLRRNGYEEVGNDRSFAPPSHEEIAARAQDKRAADVPYTLNEETLEATP